MVTFLPWCRPLHTFSSCIVNEVLKTQISQIHAFTQVCSLLHLFAFHPSIEARRGENMDSTAMGRFTEGTKHRYLIFTGWENADQPIMYNIYNLSLPIAEG